MSKAVVHPQWVYLDGDELKKIRHVTDFSTIPLRPKVKCPECDENVVLALGHKNIHHYRHSPDSNCALKGNRESIMHSNVKFHIQNELRLGKSFIVKQECIYIDEHYCDEINSTELFEGWEDVKAECKVSKYIADVALLKEGEVVGVIEVWVSHKTEGEKKEYLNKKIPWVEIRVDNENYLEIMNWSIIDSTGFLNGFGVPIVFPQKVYCSSLPLYICKDCKSAIKRKEQSRQRKREEEVKQKEIDKKVEELENLPSVVKCLGIRDIDFLFYSGKTYRNYLCLFADYRDGIILRTWLQFKGRMIQGDIRIRDRVQ